MNLKTIFSWEDESLYLIFINLIENITFLTIKQIQFVQNL